MRASNASTRVWFVIFSLSVLVAVMAWRILFAVPVAAQGNSKVNPVDGLTYVLIPSGTFQMGCSAGDVNCLDEEKPAHSVTITKSFWIGQTTVTQAAFKKVAGTPDKFNLLVNGDFAKDGRLPVEGVSWDDAQTYCQSVQMRLPTEAEWEYAARGGSAAVTYGPLDQIAWYDANSGAKAHEVGQKQPNRYGLYDMLGNVWEWTADWYGPYDAAKVTDPKGAPGGLNRVLRGGSWSYDVSFVRASARLSDNPGGPQWTAARATRSSGNVPFGFRCVAN